MTTGSQALTRVRARLGRLYAGASADRCEHLGTELFAVVDALDFTAALRRTVTNPDVPADVREDLIRRTLVDQDAAVRDAMADLARARWSVERDMADAAETLALDAMFAAAEATGDLDRLEDELFRFERLLVGDRDLRVALSDRSYPPELRVQMVTGLLTGQVCGATLRLVQRVTMRLRSRTVPVSLRLLIHACAERRRRLLAEVTAATELDEARLERLGEILTRAYGQEVQLNVSVDPDILGGLRIQVGDDLVDASMIHRLTTARRSLTNQ